MTRKNETTLGVPMELRKEVSAAADKSGMRVREWTQLALRYVLDNIVIKIEIDEPIGGTK
ncbi:hypothetical protein LCGC14_0249780 [marine sediment metagenome]|uniref:Uncharacterized protein n=1 Tax=marine sediment metagenome TaxID=412755 RepID=A0A0F9U5A6_9ZZZZ